MIDANSKNIAYHANTACTSMHQQYLDVFYNDAVSWHYFDAIMLLIEVKGCSPDFRMTILRRLYVNTS